MIPVSIIVSCYNIEQYLPKCIDSILSQTFADFECIIVDDCSTDRSPEICDKYAESDKRVKVIHNEKNGGLPQTRKIGFDASQGSYIQFVDGDDWLEKEMLGTLYQKAISEDCDLAVCCYFHELGEAAKIYKQDFSSYDKIKIIKKILKVKIKAVVWNKLVKRELILLVDFPVYSHGEDYVITLQNIYNAKRIAYIDVPLYHYRYNQNSLSHNKEIRISGAIEENRNWKKNIAFLKEKYCTLKPFEPELSSRVNDFKAVYLLDRELRSIRELFELYPESKYPYTLVKRLLVRILRKTISSITKKRMD